MRGLRLPAVTRRNWEAGRSYHHRWDVWRTGPQVGMRITAVLGTPYVPTDGPAVHLDGALAFAAENDIDAAPLGRTAWVVPLPLRCLWVSEEGLPLWACSDLLPSDPVATGQAYWHKRYPSHRSEFSAKPNANTKAGRWKDYRVPLTTIATERLEAYAIGDPAEVQRLLDTYVSHVGKKPSQGYGRVLRWLVEPAEVTEADVLRWRTTPAAYWQGKPLPEGMVIGPRRSWTPPYWYRPWQAVCVVPARG